MAKKLPDTDQDALRDSAAAYDGFLATGYMKPTCILDIGSEFDLEAYKTLIENSAQSTDDAPKIIENKLE